MPRLAGVLLNAPLSSSFVPQGGVRARHSIDSRGDADDHAMAESFFSTLACECLAKLRFATHTDARLVLFRCIEGWYSPHRRHSALGQRSPLAFEQFPVVPSKAA